MDLEVRGDSDGGDCVRRQLQSGVLVASELIEQESPSLTRMAAPKVPGCFTVYSRDATNGLRMADPERLEQDLTG